MMMVHSNGNLFVKNFFISFSGILVHFLFVNIQPNYLHITIKSASLKSTVHLFTHLFIYLFIYLFILNETICDFMLS